MKKSLEALEKLYDGFQYGMAGRNFYDTVKQNLDLLNYLISLGQIKKGKIVIEIDKETNFETYTKIKEVLENDK